MHLPVYRYSLVTQDSLYVYVYIMRFIVLLFRRTTMLHSSAKFHGALSGDGAKMRSPSWLLVTNFSSIVDNISTLTYVYFL